MLWDFKKSKNKTSKSTSLFSEGHLGNFFVKPEESSGIPSSSFVQKVMLNLIILLAASLGVESQFPFTRMCCFFLEIIIVNITLPGHTSMLARAVCSVHSVSPAPSSVNLQPRRLHGQNPVTCDVVILKCWARWVGRNGKEYRMPPAPPAALSPAVSSAAPLPHRQLTTPPPPAHPSLPALRPCPPPLHEARPGAQPPLMLPVFLHLGLLFAS